MRVWDCDPSELCDKHLRAQHAEIHFAIRCIEGGWKTKWKDVDRFRYSHCPRGLAWLGFCHEVTIRELVRRGRFSGHKTPVTTVHREALDAWIHPGNAIETYLDVLALYGYPWTQLNQGTPWERDGVSYAWYRQHEKDWTRQLAKEEHGRVHS